jgi:hypothetical protein
MNNELIKLCIDTGKNKLESNFSIATGNKSVKEAFQEIMGTDKPDYKTFRRHKNDIFEIIETALDEVITSGWTGNEFFNQFVEFKSNKLGDKNEFDVPDNSILTVAKVARGVYDLRRQRLDSGSVFSVPVSAYSVAIVEDFLRVVSGRLDWSAFVAKVAQAYDLKVKDDVYAAVKGSIAYLPTAFKETGTFDKAKLQAIIDHVKAANGGANVAVIGTGLALSSVYGTADITWSDAMKDSFNNTGKVGFWRGNPLMEIPQVHTINTFNFALDDTQLFVVPNDTKFIKAFEEGDAIIDENSDGSGTKDKSITYSLVKEMGVSCIFNKIYGAYDI